LAAIHACRIDDIEITWLYGDELVTVIIILGILSAIALPKLVDLTNETLDGAVHGIAVRWAQPLLLITRPSSPIRRRPGCSA
jgi:hypothetical protein